MTHKTDAQQQAFLAAYEITMNVVAAGRACKLRKQQHYIWMRSDEQYRERFNEARLRAADALEAEARRRAVEGVKRKKFHNGEPVIDPATKQQYIENEYSDTLLIFMLKGLKPDVYKDASKQITVNLNELVAANPALASATPAPGAIPALPRQEAIQDSAGGTP